MPAHPATTSTTALSCHRASLDALTPTRPASPERRSQLLAQLREEGIRISECIEALAVTEEDRFVRTARQLAAEDDQLSLDDATCTAPSADGAFVLCWLWVSNDEAGVLRHSDLWDTVLRHARRYIKSATNLDDETRQLRLAQAEWLEELVMNYADELDGIEDEVIKGLPGPIQWEDASGRSFRFMPSDALSQLRLLARRKGLTDDLTNQADSFCVRYGNKLDAILTVLQLDPDAPVAG